MSRIRSADTSPELKARKYLYAHGFRYRLRPGLPGRPDVVFPGRRIAVFINGCFWHMHGCRLSATPSTRREYWEAKLAGNRDRDLRNRLKLEGMGWTVITVWECEIESSIELAMSPLLKALGGE